jgi:hypothetical protein
MTHSVSLFCAKGSQTIPTRKSTRDVADAARLPNLCLVMPRYYFHVHDGDALDRDDIGADLHDLREIRAEAVTIARELRSLWDDLPSGALDKMAIMVGAGEIVLITPFTDAKGRDG